MIAPAYAVGIPIKKPKGIRLRPSPIPNVQAPIFLFFLTLNQLSCDIFDFKP